MSTRYFAISSFFIKEDHQLALVKLTDEQIENFKSMRDQLSPLKRVNPGLHALVLDFAPVIWLPWDEELLERANAEISAREYEFHASTHKDDYEEPESSYTYVTTAGLHFRCTTETDDGYTATIMWAALEPQKWLTS